MTRVEEERGGREDERAERCERRYLLRVGGPLGGLQKWLARLVSPSVKKSKSKLAPSLAVWSRLPHPPLSRVHTIRH